MFTKIHYSIPKWCLAIYAVGTVPLLGSLSLQCCYCSSICYNYLLSLPTLRLQIHTIHNSVTKGKILLSMQLGHFQFKYLLHSSVAAAPVSVTTTCCRYRRRDSSRRDSRSWKSPAYQSTLSIVTDPASVAKFTVTAKVEDCCLGLQN